MVTSDQYPLRCNMTHLNACVPPWHFDQGLHTQTMAERDSGPCDPPKVRAEMEGPAIPLTQLLPQCRRLGGVLVSLQPHLEVEGKTIRPICKGDWAGPL